MRDELSFGIRRRVTGAAENTSQMPLSSAASAGDQAFEFKRRAILSIASQSFRRSSGSTSGENLSSRRLSARHPSNGAFKTGFAKPAAKAGAAAAAAANIKRKAENKKRGEARRD